MGKGAAISQLIDFDSSLTPTIEKHLRSLESNHTTHAFFNLPCPVCNAKGAAENDLVFDGFVANFTGKLSEAPNCRNRRAGALR